MTVDSQSAAKSEYKEQTYYFCSNGCKVQFDKDPQKYASQPHDEHAAHHH
jgi:YHS domain-containing protein